MAARLEIRIMQRARHCAGLGASSTPTERPFFTYLQRGEGEPSVDEEALSDELSDPYRHSSTGTQGRTPAPKGGPRRGVSVDTPRRTQRADRPLGSSPEEILRPLGYSSGEIPKGGPTSTSADVSVPRLAGFSLIT